MRAVMVDSIVDIRDSIEVNSTASCWVATATPASIWSHRSRGGQAGRTHHQSHPAKKHSFLLKKWLLQKDLLDRSAPVHHEPSFPTGLPITTRSALPFLLASGRARETSRCHRGPPGVGRVGDGFKTQGYRSRSFTAALMAGESARTAAKIAVRLVETPVLEVK